MSSIPARNITGDVSIGRNVSLGGNATIRGSAEIGHNLRVKGWLDAKNIKSVNKGLFKSEEQLKEAYPTPRTGWFALVGDSVPAQVYMAIGGVWVPQYNDDGSPKMSGELTLDSAIYLETVEELIGELEGVKADIENTVKLIENNRNLIVEGDEELLKRIQGRSDNSQSLYDPFKVLPGGIDAYGNFETIAGILRSLNSLVPGLSGENADTLCGYFRCFLTGTPIKVFNTPMYYAEANILQYVVGPFSIDDNGFLVLSDDYHILRRRHHKDTGWGKWEQYKVLTVDEVNSIIGSINNLQEDVKNINDDISNLQEDVKGNKNDIGNLQEDVKNINDDISNLQEDVKEIDKKIADSETVVAALTNPDINDICDSYGKCVPITESELAEAFEEDYGNHGCSSALLSDVLNVLEMEEPDCDCGCDVITKEEIENMN